MKKIILLLLFIGCAAAYAQESFPVTDTVPVVYAGFKAGYTITDASEKEVGSKGNFSRYKIRFFVTNAGPDSRLFIRKQGGGLFNNGGASDRLVEFKCANATGARLTGKTAMLNMKPCYIDAEIEEKECGTDKNIRVTRQANIGYWIRPGETITSNVIMIVPLNERPNMSVSFFPLNTGYTVTTDYNGTLQPVSSSGFVRLKNISSNTFINNERGPAEIGRINYDQWSAQWEILPVNGSNNFLIRNRWKNNFLTTDNSNMLTDDSRSPKALWSIVETETNNVYYIKNAADNSKLMVDNGVLWIGDPFRTNSSAQWSIEH